jgi:hypothetical protein
MPAPEEILFAFLDLSGSGTMSANMQRTTSRFLIAALVVALSFAALLFATLPRAAGQTDPSPARRAQLPRSLRLYVFDCGTIHVADLSRFSLKPEEVATTDLSVACFLVTHPKGTLIWDAGAVPDSAWKPTGTASTQHVVLPDSQQRAKRRHPSQIFGRATR